MKKLLLITLGVVLSLPAFARSFTYRYKNQTLTYDVINEAAKTVSVKGDEFISGVLEIPSKVSDGEDTYVVISIDENAFSHCSSLASVTIPNSVTEIGLGVFNNCHSLTSVTIPSSVTEIGGWAFYDCHSLTSVTIPNSVTEIGEGAFCGCEGLTSVMIPNSVTKIGSDAFRDCSGLTAIYYNARKPISVGYSIFPDEVYYNATLYLPKEAIVYAGALEPWKNFKNIVAYDFGHRKSPGVSRHSER